MHNFRNVALGFLGAAALASASDVHDLKKDTFDDFVKENDLVLAEFFAPWCGRTFYIPCPRKLVESCN